MQSSLEARYRVDVMHARSLENNPLGSPVERSVSVYLPPGYFDDPQRRYPVIYFLHGYDGNHAKLVILPTNEDLQKLAAFLPAQLTRQVSLDRIVSFTMLDDLIRSGKLDPFILVQPDASLLIPRQGSPRDMMTGQISTKGSFYINSRWTGAYESYIIRDVVSYIDSSYRTNPDPSRRAIAGTSMGGYGALRIYLRHRRLFAAVAAASPANFTISSLETKHVQPLMVQLMGQEAAETMGAASMNDILDTMDMAYSGGRPLLPTVKRDGKGLVTCYDARAAAAWHRYDLNNLIKNVKEAPTNTSIRFDCHKDDEFDLASAATRLHQTLLERGINHIFELYDDPDAALWPHTLGTGYHIIDNLAFCSRIINQ